MTIQYLLAPSKDCDTYQNVIHFLKNIDQSIINQHPVLLRLKQIIESNSEEIKLTQSELDELEELTGSPEDNLIIKHMLNLPSRHEHHFIKL